jgi:hypothetical protein
MRVFVSSVRRGLEAERDAVPGLILALGHEPVSFEDFPAQALPSREACLRAVASADAYLLMLGPVYGDPLPDTGASPTEEEWNAARTRGIPMLVFRKRGVPLEPAQAEFVARVEDYVSGRFRASFDGVKDLLVAVADSLRAIASGPTPLVWTPLAQPPSVAWLDRRQLAQSTKGILELQFVPTTAVRIRATELPAISAGILRLARASGLFEETSGARTSIDEDGATVELDGRESAGVRVRRDGSVIVWTPLPQDT